MKTSLIALAVGVASAVCAVPASAQMLSQFYVGAGGGRSDVGDTDTSWKLYAGGEFNKMFGAEVAYNDLGSFSGVDVSSWSLAALAKWPLNPTWNVFAKAGVTRNRLSNGISERDTEPLLGVGVGMDFNPNVGLRLEYEDFGKTPEVAGSDERITNWALSVNYKF